MSFSAGFFNGIAFSNNSLEITHVAESRVHNKKYFEPILKLKSII